MCIYIIPDMSKRLLFVPLCPVGPLVTQQLTIGLNAFILAILWRALHNTYMYIQACMHAFCFELASSRQQGISMTATRYYIPEQSQYDCGSEIKKFITTYTYMYVHRQCVACDSHVTDLVERIVAIEAAVLHQTQYSNLVLVLTILGILRDMPRLQKMHIHVYTV